MPIHYVALCALACASPLQDADPPPGIVSYISVLSDKVPDLSSIEAWKKAFIKDGMTDEQKAMAVWRRHLPAPGSPTARILAGREQRPGSDQDGECLWLLAVQRGLRACAGA